MATYKVPQDVEADDKLLGPFSFRQFVYLMIVFGTVLLAVGLFQIFPLLAVIPLPVTFFFIILALPLKKDQPMETYLAAVISFYTKPRQHFWMPGMSESTILITAPKKVEENRTRDITGEEAGHRLSFLANIVDTEGYAIKSADSPMRDDFYAEAYNARDMFDHTDSARLNAMITQEQKSRHEEIVAQMRAAIAQSDYNYDRPAPNTMKNNTVVQPQTIVTPPANKRDTRMNELANNPDFSVETIQQQADRIRRENDSEVYISLH